MVILFIPLADTVIAFGRRIASGKSPFKADLGHIHYKLLERFGSHKRASFVLSSVSGIFSAFGLIFLFVSVKYRSILVFVTIVSISLLFYFVWMKDTKT